VSKHYYTEFLPAIIEAAAEKGAAMKKKTSSESRFWKKATHFFCFCFSHDFSPWFEFFSIGKETQRGRIVNVQSFWNPHAFVLVDLFKNEPFLIKIIDL